LTFYNAFVEQLQFEQLFILVKNLNLLEMTLFDIRAVSIILTSARTVSSSRDFGVEQFFRADEFRAVDPSPKFLHKKKKIMLAKRFP
jgi:hypothetical protein